MSTSTVLYDAPGPRARRRNLVVSLITAALLVVGICWLISALASTGQMTAAKWEPFTDPDVWETYILPGIQGTLTAAAISIVLALGLGLLLAVGRMSTVAPVRWAAGTVVEFFRAIPVLVMMIFSFFLYSQLDAFDSDYLALAGVVTGLTLYNSAVIAEIVRAGVNALPRGQSEAACALGLRPGQTMRIVLLPQAITAMLPALISQLVVVLKDTSIGWLITFFELVRQGTQLGARFSNFIPALIVVAVLMITINILLSWLAVRVERRLRRSGHTAALPTTAARSTQADTPVV